MKILAENINKKFRQEYVIRDFSFEIQPNQKIAITGQNGSGKSTLLKILAQFALPTKGKVLFKSENEQIISDDKSFNYVSYVAPYVDIIEEFTLTELLSFLQKLNYLPGNISLNKFEDYLHLSPNKDKLIKNYSSGMRQKVKLGTAFLSHRPLLFLDEPTSNLDVDAKKWFSKCITSTENKTIVIASNEPNEIELCNSIIKITDYK
jgi:ABC-type multidrug transport system ATPase subunit